VAEESRRWRAELLWLDPNRLVLVDETWAS
jgi:hypothetical protein